MLWFSDLERRWSSKSELTSDAAHMWAQIPRNCPTLAFLRRAIPGVFVVHLFFP
jgi:hypothetical protein